MTITSPFRFFVFIGGVAAFLLLLAWLFLWGGGAVRQSGEITIESGASAKAVWSELVAEGYTSRTLPWRYHAWRQDAASELKVGTYQLTAGESVAGVVERFTTGETVPDELTITYPEGFTLRQMAARTAARGIGTEAEFIAAANPANYSDTYPYLLGLGEGRTLEGYLFPDTYQVFPDDTPAEVVRRMLANFDRKLTEDLRTQARSQGRTLDELVIMASIIEREVIKDEDMALVSGVLWNRVNADMGLDADATVRYALNKWDEPLTVTDLQTDSPYNTRRYKGLPVGPISSPGLRALVAAAYPTETDYFYYLSAPSGETIFAETNDEHNRNKAEYLQ